MRKTYEYDHLGKQPLRSSTNDSIKQRLYPWNSLQLHTIQNVSLTVQIGTILLLYQWIVMAKTAGQGESTVKYTINLMDRPAQHEYAAQDMIYKLDYLNYALVKSIVTLEHAKE